MFALMNSSVNEATDAVSVSDMVEMFWYTTEKPSLFTANGIEITVQGKKYPYEVFSAPGEPDLEWRRRNTYKKFYVQYDPYDMSSVRLLYKDKGGENLVRVFLSLYRDLDTVGGEQRRFLGRVPEHLHHIRHTYRIGSLVHAGIVHLNPGDAGGRVFH